MSGYEALGIEGLESLHYYVHDLERSRAFYVDRLAFEERGSMRDGSRLFEAGECRIRCSVPTGEDPTARRFLRHHPDGIGAVVFRVSDAQRAFEVLERRGATPIDDLGTYTIEGGPALGFAITTPFGGCEFRFVEQAARPPIAAARTSAPYLRFDHLTANFETLAPAALWLEHVLGFRDFWKVELATRREDERAHPSDTHAGTGLRSRVLVDPESGLKLALNEPRRPNFHASQIDVFVDDNRGPGIQHAAIAVHDLPGTVASLRARGVEFLATPAAYYDALAARLASQGISRLDEDVDELRRLGILVDGTGEGRYLLQIFMRDSASLYHEREAGPFFFELIERKGDPGFGEGNFRALFESIERDQARVPEGGT
jgi:4-hydroxyphenylpyruvate dioxygenase